MCLRHHYIQHARREGVHPRPLPGTWRATGETDKLAKLISEEPDAELKSAHDENAEFRAWCLQPDVPDYLEQAQVLEGLVRNPGKHASGILIASKPLEDVVPMVRQGDEGEMVAGFDGETVAEMGLLKMDFLGLKTLSVISDAQGHIRSSRAWRTSTSRKSLSTTKTRSSCFGAAARSESPV